MADPLKHLRKICLALPDATEKLSHGEPTWFAKKVFAMYDNHHHDADHVGFWCPQPPGALEALVGSDPKRFFVPPYVGGKGWVGVRLDVEPVDWDEIAELVEESYRLVGPKVGIARLDERLPGNTKADKQRAYAKVGKICLALPEVVMKPFGGHWAPSWRVEDKIFCSSGQVGRTRINVKGARGAQEALVKSDPEKFFVPDYSGPKGWVGAWLDVEQDWDELSELIEESYRLVAPKRLVKQLEAFTSRD